jgi:hypothetical protein
MLENVRKCHRMFKKHFLTWYCAQVLEKLPDRTKVSYYTTTTPALANHAKAPYSERLLRVQEEIFLKTWALPNGEALRPKPTVLWPLRPKLTVLWLVATQINSALTSCDPERPCSDLLRPKKKVHWQINRKHKTKCRIPSEEDSGGRQQNTIQYIIEWGPAHTPPATGRRLGWRWLPNSQNIVS